MNHTVIPAGYEPTLSLYETQAAISLIKRTFQDHLAQALNLKRVSAPLFVDPASGLNDDLNGVERPVSFDIPAAGMEAQVVHSLAKWKRMALYRYDFHTGKGIYADMNAIRRDEELDNLHSIYVDQWDWERVITKEQRTLDTLKDTVREIFKIIKHMQHEVWYKYPEAVKHLPKDIYFITSQELEDLYPDNTPKERENLITREHGCVFLMQIGDKLAGGKPHDGRAPDYDDWKLNGDILFWFEHLQCALEISSMGIRVDEAALEYQLKKAGCEDRRSLPYHKMLLNGQLPYTIGGGIGQSRLCMLLLDRAHIGEVQASMAPKNARYLRGEQDLSAVAIGRERIMESNISIFFIIEIIGTVAFASSGALVAIKQRLDLLGVVVLGVTTAVGGGMLRDIILGIVPPSLFMNPVYVYTAFLTAMVLFILVWLNQQILESRYISAYEKMMNLFDAIGLGAFTVTGINTAGTAGYGEYHFLSIFLGVLTGVGGGILRDMLAGQSPYILRKHVYASASIAGAVCYVCLNGWLSRDASMILSAILVVLIRLLATRYDWNLPTAYHTKNK